MSDDPIIRSMQDPAPSAPPPAPSTPSASPFITPPRGLGNPPSSDAQKPKIAYRAPDAPKEPRTNGSNNSAARPTNAAPTPPTPVPTTPAVATAVPTPPKPQTPPQPQKSMTPPSPSPSVQPPVPPEPPAAKPIAHQSHGGYGALTVGILTLLLLVGSIVALWMNMNTIASRQDDANGKTNNLLALLQTNVTDVRDRVAAEAAANTQCKQDLFDSGSDELQCADTDRKIADVLIAEGTRLKTEGDAAKDQPKSMQGQWLIDRGNELKQNADKCTTSGTEAQHRSGIPVNK